MSDPFVGEIRMFGGNFAPMDWAFCNGQTLQISQNDILFSLIGTTYGGDGQTTFALPDLRGRLPMHRGNGHMIGEKAGTETASVAENQLGAHTHPVAANTSPGTTNNPQNAFWAAAENGSNTHYASDTPSQAMNGGLVGVAGGNLPHENMMPYLAVNFIIALNGYYPTRE